MTKKKSIGLIIFIIGFIAMCTYNLSRIGNTKVSSLNYEIIGIVEKVELDEKRIATIYVNQSEFYLYDFRVKFDGGIKRGDSIYKKKNSPYLKHYKKYPNGFYLNYIYEVHE